MANICDYCDSELTPSLEQNWRGEVIKDLDGADRMACPNGHPVIAEVTLASDTIKIDAAIARLVNVVTSNAFGATQECPYIDEDNFPASTVEVTKTEKIVTFHKFIETKEEATVTESPEGKKYNRIEQIKEPEEGTVYLVKDKNLKYISYEKDIIDPLYPEISVTITPSETLEPLKATATVSIDGKWSDLGVLSNPIKFILDRNHVVKIFWTESDVEIIEFNITHR